MYLTMANTAERAPEVRYHPGSSDEGMAVQAFLGSSYQSLYMTVDEARSFAEQILAAVPAPAEAEA